MNSNTSFTSQDLASEVNEKLLSSLRKSQKQLTEERQNPLLHQQTRNEMSAFPSSSPRLSSTAVSEVSEMDDSPRVKIISASNNSSSAYHKASSKQLKSHKNKTVNYNYNDNTNNNNINNNQACISNNSSKDDTDNDNVSGKIDDNNERKLGQNVTSTNFNSGSNNNRISLSRSVQLVSSGFESLSRTNKSFKHQSGLLCSRTTKFERFIIISLSVIAISTTLLFILQLSSFLSNQKRRQQQEIVPFMSKKEAESLYCLTPDCVKVAASVIEAIDNSVDPCDNFYQYACGEWIKTNPLPDGKANWGAFNKLWQDNQAIMRSVLESSNYKQDSAEYKAKVYYESCLDKNDTIEAKGAKPMQDLIESAGGWSFSKNFDIKNYDFQSALQIYHNQYNRGGLFSWIVGADERNSSRNIIQLDQSGLGLPTRDYYFNKTDKHIIDAYLNYMIKIAELMGGKNCEEPMKDVLEFEKSIAKITLPQDQRRNDESMYHKFTLDEFQKRASFLNWTKYFDDAFDFHSRTSISYSSIINNSVRKMNSNNEMIYNVDDSNNDNTNNDNNLKRNAKRSLDDNVSSTTESPSKKAKRLEDEVKHSLIAKHHINGNESVVIYSPEYFDDLSLLVDGYMKTDRGKAAIANYLAWSVIQSLVPSLPKSFRDASKVLRKALIGSEGMEVPWRYCISDTNQVMGYAMGSLFVKRVFKGESKVRVEQMINSIREAFQENMDSLDWMDDRTRELAREKAEHIKEMIGFPEFILHSEKLDQKYHGLELDEGNYFENNIKVNVLSLRENMEKINRPSNKTEWEMSPPTVNAYYTPTKNQIVLPAGILQTPFYNLAYPSSLNYGAMGVVLGHELTHAFDDQGREYDKDGNLEKWWYNETLRNFEERVKCLVDQYSEYKIDESHLNGKQTLGENIADNGGLKAAFRAYERWAKSNPAPVLPGLNLTNSQMFFVGFAQVWCSNSTPEALRLQVLNDVHAPPQYRVIGTLSNSKEFAKEFGCPTNSKMNPEKKCVVW